jgi:sugar phosphate isomerase/epimerase
MIIKRAHYPFTLGTTSYIYPIEQDNLEENVRLLMHSFDKIQLLFFGKSYLDEVLRSRTIDTLRTCQQESGIRYAIHLPLDLYLLEGNAALKEGTAVIDRIIRACKPLEIDNMILHIEPLPSNNNNEIWSLVNFASVLNSISRCFPSLIPSIHIENTFYDLVPYRDIIGEKGFSVCMDIGHLYRTKQSFPFFTERMHTLIREIHLHGFNAESDHQSLSVTGKKYLSEIADYLKSYHHSLILEVFKEPDLVSSLETLGNMLKGATYEL